MSFSIETTAHQSNIPLDPAAIDAQATVGFAGLSSYLTQVGLPGDLSLTRDLSEKSATFRGIML